MSTIYSAGQYEDAFSPKRLGNWEACSKNVCCSLLERRPQCARQRGTTQVIVDERGHLLPGLPRNKATAWGLLQYYMRNASVPNSGQWGNPRQEATLYTPTSYRFLPNRNSLDPSFSQEKSKKKSSLPRYFPKPRKSSPPKQHDEDILLEYLKELGLPIVWIVGPASKGILNERKKFSTELAKRLSFGYVSLDDKIQEWKERQERMALNNIDLAKPTSVPPQLSANLPYPKRRSAVLDVSYLTDTQRITFDSALPIDRNKILDLYKFAMAESLPCKGFVIDSVPYDLAEGIAFEKLFYPSALAIYLAEGEHSKKKQHKKMLGPLEYLESHKKAKEGENFYPRPKTHRRLGTFGRTEAEKICNHFGSKIIRISNAEEMERDTMEFLNELVKKNLQNYHKILEGKAKLECVANDFDRYFCSSSLPPLGAEQGGNQHPSAISPHYSYTSTFITDDEAGQGLKTPKSWQEIEMTTPEQGIGRGASRTKSWHERESTNLGRGAATLKAWQERERARSGRGLSMTQSWQARDSETAMPEPMKPIYEKTPKSRQGIETAKSGQGIETPNSRQGIEPMKPIYGIETKPGQGTEKVKSGQGIETPKSLQGVDTKSRPGIESTTPGHEIDKTSPLQGVATTPDQGIKAVKSRPGIEFTTPSQEKITPGQGALKPRKTFLIDPMMAGDGIDTMKPRKTTVDGEGVDKPRKTMQGTDPEPEHEKEKEENKKGKKKKRNSGDDCGFHDIFSGFTDYIFEMF